MGGTGRVEGESAHGQVRRPCARNAAQTCHPTPLPSHRAPRARRAAQGRPAAAAFGRRGAAAVVGRVCGCECRCAVAGRGTSNWRRPVECEGAGAAVLFVTLSRPRARPARALIVPRPARALARIEVASLPPWTPTARRPPPSRLAAAAAAVGRGGGRAAGVAGGGRADGVAVGALALALAPPLPFKLQRPAPAVGVAVPVQRSGPGPQAVALPVAQPVARSAVTRRRQRRPAAPAARHARLGSAGIPSSCPLGPPAGAAAAGGVCRGAARRPLPPRGRGRLFRRVLVVPGRARCAVRAVQPGEAAGVGAGVEGRRGG